jgi:hypothetical protein
MNANKFNQNTANWLMTLGKVNLVF